MKKAVLSILLLLVWITTNSCKILKYKVVEIKSEVEYRIEEYLNTNYPTTPLKANWVMQYSQEFGVSPEFILTVSQLETSHATNPNAIRCYRNKTIFSQGEWDDGSSRISYTTYKESVRDFCKLIKTDYLVDGKTEQQLVENFVNREGYRYASFPQYEKYMRIQYQYFRRILY